MITDQEKIQAVTDFLAAKSASAPVWIEEDYRAGDRKNARTIECIPHVITINDSIEVSGNERIQEAVGQRESEQYSTPEENLANNGWKKGDTIYAYVRGREVHGNRFSFVSKE